MNKKTHVQNLLNSFEKLTGKKIINRSNPDEDLKRVMQGLFVLVSHNGAQEPILNYGNPFALNLWEMDWDSFTKTPSSKTAEPDLREQRKEMLDMVTKQGYFDDYNGVRISATGKRFLIKNAIIWNVQNEIGENIGQAAYFKKIVFF